jgi:Tol biopolymer transport system component
MTDPISHPKSNTIPTARLILKQLLLVSIFFAFITPSPSSHAQTPSPTLLTSPLVATTNADENGFILFDLSNGTQRDLSFGPSTQNFWGFSPDGCNILFTHETSPDNFDLFTAKLDGSEERKLADLTRGGSLNYRVWEPTWSSDGQHIAFTLFRYFDPPNDYPYRESHVAWVSPDGGPPNFYSNTGMEYQPRWSSDGAFLVYVSEQPDDDDENTDTVAVDPAAEPTESPVTPPYFGSDSVPLPPTKAELWIVSADGTDKRQFASFEDGGLFNPRWSPDDQSIAFIYEPIPTKVMRL